MNRAATRSKVPLGQHNSNVSNGNNASGKTNGGSKSSSSILPSKKDSRLQLLERKASSSSGVSDGEGNNKAFTSMGSDTLRRALSSASMASSSTSGGSDANNKQQPLGQSSKSKHANNVNRNAHAVSSSSSVSKPSSSSGEPITIVEHRKRPCGDGYTVHKYLRGKLLGKGGFAKVYKVTSLDTNKEYAVKIVPKANLVKSRARQKVSFCC